MPPENSRDEFILRCLTPNGEWETVPERPVPVVLTEHIDPDKISKKPFEPSIIPRGDDAVEFCGTFKGAPITRKRLSRKRIKKLLMSLGMPRNFAEAFARNMAQKCDIRGRKIAILLLMFDFIREVSKHA